MSEVFIHIGTEKTGTTTVQTGLTNARAQLAEQGVLYPKCLGLPNHLYLPAACMEEKDGAEILAYTLFQTKLTYAELAPELKRRFTAELHGVGARKVIISNEHLHSRLTNKASKERLHDFFADMCDTIKIIVYIRRQDKVAVSLHSTLLKHGNTNIKYLLPDTSNYLPYYFNYWEIVESYSEVFGAENVIVRPLEPGVLVNDDVLDDVVACTGIEFPESCRPPRLNESLSVEGKLFLERFNRRAPLFVDGKPNRLRNGVIQFIEKYATGKSVSVSRAEAETFYRSFQSSNEQLRKKYLPDLTGPMFSEDFSSYPLEVSETADPDKVADLATDIWMELATRLLVEQSSVK